MPTWPTSSSRRSNHPEGDLQRSIIELCKLHEHVYPDLCQAIFHVPNGAHMDPRHAAILVGQGMRRGVPDLILPRPRRGYVGMAIELKAPGSLKDVSTAQKIFARMLHAEGWFVIVCDDAAVAWAALTWYVKGERHFVIYEEPGDWVNARHVLLGEQI